jgi:two-component system phosphate regulon response regulator PhoB
MSAQILIVEDELGIQELISVNLSRAGHHVRCASDAESALDQLNMSLPDLILMDWMLPKMSGIDLTRLIRSESRTAAVPIIMLTARDEERNKITALELGADDYITKPFSPRELLARITVVLRRRAPQVTADLVCLGELVLDPGTKVVTAKGKRLDIGPTEFRLLHFLMTHAGKVHSREHLLNKVWGEQYYGNQRTVDVHIRRLRAAMEPESLHEMIQTMRGSGYLFSPQQ